MWQSQMARQRFLTFATGGTARWPGNFRDLNAAITRMATLAPAGRIGLDQVQAEVAYMTATWSGASERRRAQSLIDRVVVPTVVAELDRFDRVQLEAVLGVCRTAASLSAAGRPLFDRSRQRKKIANDADRLRKYLARFDLEWSEVKDRLGHDEVE